MFYTFHSFLVELIDIVSCSVFCRFILIVLRLTNLRALVLHPQVDADERVGADDVGARVVGGAVLLQVPRHRRLTPLGPVQGRRERQGLPLQPGVERKDIGVKKSSILG